MSQTIPAFDVLGPLPDGVAVLEASAGTGKTFTIAALAARYVAAGIPLSSILIVTFTRMATGELRERVRERIVSAERILTDVASGAAVPAGDEVAGLLAQGTAEDVARDVFLELLDDHTLVDLADLDRGEPACIVDRGAHRDDLEEVVLAIIA